MFGRVLPPAIPIPSLFTIPRRQYAVTLVTWMGRGARPPISIPLFLPQNAFFFCLTRLFGGLPPIVMSRLFSCDVSPSVLSLSSFPSVRSVFYPKSSAFILLLFYVPYLFLYISSPFGEGSRSLPEAPPCLLTVDVSPPDTSDKIHLIFQLSPIPGLYLEDWRIDVQADPSSSLLSGKYPFHPFYSLNNTSFGPPFQLVI